MRVVRGVGVGLLLVAAGTVLAMVLARACGVGDPTYSAWWGARVGVDETSVVIPISVRLGSSSCNRLERVATTETDEDVTIVATVRRIGGGGGGCTDDLAGEAVDVELERPLGDRELRGCEHRDRRPCAEAGGLPG
jgi:hypothetical protein